MFKNIDRSDEMMKFQPYFYIIKSNFSRESNASCFHGPHAPEDTNFHKMPLYISSILQQTNSTRSKNFKIIGEAAKQLAKKPNRSVISEEGINLYQFLPYDHQLFYHYRGSLTTHDCKEFVHWIVLKNTTNISYLDVRCLVRVCFSFMYVIVFASWRISPIFVARTEKSSRAIIESCKSLRIGLCPWGAADSTWCRKTMRYSSHKNFINAHSSIINKLQTKAITTAANCSWYGGKKVLAARRDRQLLDSVRTNNLNEIYNPNKSEQQIAHGRFNSLNKNAYQNVINGSTKTRLVGQVCFVRT